MYILMITDLIWTLMHHEAAGELNPLFSRLLSDDEILFVYVKLIVNSIAAFAVILISEKRPVLGYILAIFGIIVYGSVVWLHWFVDRALASVPSFQNSPIWTFMQSE